MNISIRNFLRGRHQKGDGVFKESRQGSDKNSGFDFNEDDGEQCLGFSGSYYYQSIDDDKVDSESHSILGQGPTTTQSCYQEKKKLDESSKKVKSTSRLVRNIFPRIKRFGSILVGFPRTEYRMSPVPMFAVRSLVRGDAMILTSLACFGSSKFSPAKHYPDHIAEEFKKTMRSFKNALQHIERECWNVDRDPNSTSAQRKRALEKLTNDHRMIQSLVSTFFFGAQVEQIQKLVETEFCTSQPEVWMEKARETDLAISDELSSRVSKRHELDGRNEGFCHCQVS